VSLRYVAVCFRLKLQKTSICSRPEIMGNNYF